MKKKKDELTLPQRLKAWGIVILVFSAGTVNGYFAEKIISFSVEDAGLLRSIAFAAFVNFCCAILFFGTLIAITDAIKWIIRKIRRKA